MIDCGVIAVVNILTLNLKRVQVLVILIVGAVHWVLGGVFCWALDGVRIHEIRERPHAPEHRDSALPGDTGGMASGIGLCPSRQPEEHAAAEVLIERNRR